MKKSEMGKLLTVLAQIDPRFTLTETTSEPVVKGWHDCVGDLDFGDACDVAARFYRERTDRRIMPADLLEGVKEIRRARALAMPPVEVIMAGVDPDHPRWDAISRARREALLARPTGSPLPAIMAAGETGRA